MTVLSYSLFVYSEFRLYNMFKFQPWTLTGYLRRSNFSICTVKHVLLCYLCTYLGECKNKKILFYYKTIFEVYTSQLGQYAFVSTVKRDANTYLDHRHWSAVFKRSSNGMKTLNIIFFSVENRQKFPFCGTIMF